MTELDPNWTPPSASMSPQADPVTDDPQEELTEFERALLAAIRVSSPRVKRAMAPYLLSLDKCQHGNRKFECRRCLFWVTTA